MHRTSLILLIITIVGLPYISFGQEVPYTQEDRERLIRLDTKVEEGQKAINQRIDDVNLRINDLRDEMRDLKTFMLWGFGIMFGAMGGLITIVIWDRRTAISPVVKRNKQLEAIVENVFKGYAKVEPKFADILKSTGIL